MKQAQMMQKKMEEAQEKAAHEEVLGTSGAGLVKVTLNGKFEMKKIELDKSLMVTDEIDILEDLIMAAFNDAKTKADANLNSAISGATGGMNIPGLKLPF